MKTDRDQAFSSSYVVTDSGCHEWQRYRTADGYGRFWDGSTMAQAHRWAYVRVNGPVPAGLELDHLCRNRACVNPAHLEPVTRSENQLRSPRSFRSGRDTCRHGHDITDAARALQPLVSGSFACRACNREASRRYRERRKVATS